MRSTFSVTSFSRPAMAELEPGPAASFSQSHQSEVEPFIEDIGFTELYNPSTSTPQKDTIVDIVFVHGLKGHPRDTWTHEEKSPPAQQSSTSTDSVRKPSRFKIPFGRSRNPERAATSTSPPTTKETGSCFWPYHLLSKDERLSSARLLVYGYDSHPTHFYKAANRMTITQHARQLNNRLAQVRSGSHGRALIFVAHSMGGILVKDALDEAKQNTAEPSDKDIIAFCQAIVFMGTPHLGSNIASWGETLSNIVGALPGGPTTYSQVLRGLQPDSEVLDRISRNFNRLLDENKLRICNVQEGLGVTGIKGASSKVCYPRKHRAPFTADITFRWSKTTRLHSIAPAWRGSSSTRPPITWAFVSSRLSGIRRTKISCGSYKSAARGSNSSKVRPGKRQNPASGHYNQVRKAMIACII
jgi:hypothetical protein